MTPPNPSAPPRQGRWQPRLRTAEERHCPARGRAAEGRPGVRLRLGRRGGRAVDDTPRAWGFADHTSGQPQTEPEVRPARLSAGSAGETEARPGTRSWPAATQQLCRVEEAVRPPECRMRRGPGPAGRGPPELAFQLVDSRGQLP